MLISSLLFGVGRYRLKMKGVRNNVCIYYFDGRIVIVVFGNTWVDVCVLQIKTLTGA